MIRPCIGADLDEIEDIINEAAQSYRGVIPADCWHEPYMPHLDLRAEITAGVNFWGWQEKERLAGVMGLQEVRDVCLIRHAYVLPTRQGQGIGSALLRNLANQTTGLLLVGTWAAAEWAIRFYERHGFQAVSAKETDHLLKTYWNVPPRQRESSIVLARPPEGL